MAKKKMPKMFSNKPEATGDQQRVTILPDFFVPSEHPWRILDQNTETGQAQVLKEHRHALISGADDKLGVVTRNRATVALAFSPYLPAASKKFGVTEDTLSTVEEVRVGRIAEAIGLEGQVTEEALEIPAKLEALGGILARAREDPKNEAYQEQVVMASRDLTAHAFWLLHVSSDWTRPFRGRFQVSYDAYLNAESKRTAKARLDKAEYELLQKVMKTAASAREVFGYGITQPRGSRGPNPGYGYPYERTTVPVAVCIEQAFPLPETRQDRPQGQIYDDKHLQCPPRNFDCGAKAFAQIRVTRKMGTKPKYWAKWPTSGRIFEKKPIGSRIAVLMDCSGSMRYTSEMFAAFFKNAPRAVVAGYSNEVFILMALDGKMVDPDNWGRFPGGNGSDLRGLKWLAKQEGPKYWISDGGVDTNEENVTQIWNTVYDNRITRVRSAEKFLRGLSGGYVKTLPPLPYSMADDFGDKTRMRGELLEVPDDDAEDL